MDQGIYTSLIGISSVTAGQIDSYVRSRNPSAPPLGEYYVRFGRKFNIRADIAAAQMVHETGFLLFGGDVHPEWHNPAGLSSAVPGERFQRFADWEQGVHAHYERLNCYVRPYDQTGQGGKYDNNYGHWRYGYLMEHFGSADRLYDVAQLWSTSPAEEYAGKVWIYREWIVSTPGGGGEMTTPGPPWGLIAGGAIGGALIYLIYRWWLK
ncbi:MAG: glucosaminidase domain-containing protein [Peptococcaceae bacterium]|nr:glucosaminidase domain-containing protein [Peptococcaceae bacterium]